MPLVAPAQCPLEILLPLNTLSEIHLLTIPSQYPLSQYYPLTLSLSGNGSYMSTDSRPSRGASVASGASRRSHHSGLEDRGQRLRVARKDPGSNPGANPPKKQSKHRSKGKNPTTPSSGRDEGGERGMLSSEGMEMTTEGGGEVGGDYE